MKIPFQRYYNQNGIVNKQTYRTTKIKLLKILSLQPIKIDIFDCEIVLNHFIYQYIKHGICH